MSDVVARIIPYSIEEEHILRRLGGAVIAQWDAFPESVRTLILSQAPLIYDRDHSVQLYHQIDAFIQTHQADMTKG